MKKTIERIQKLTDEELREVMEAIRKRFNKCYPEWDVFYFAIHKEPVQRRRELDELLRYIERDLQWNTEQQKKA